MKQRILIMKIEHSIFSIILAVLIGTSINCKDAPPEIVTSHGIRSHRWFSKGKFYCNTSIYLANCSMESK